jgi:hypothetical protein
VEKIQAVSPLTLPIGNFVDREKSMKDQKILFLSQSTWANLFPNKEQTREAHFSDVVKGGRILGNVCMAILGSLSGACIFILFGGEDAKEPVNFFAAYLAGGLCGMALSIFTNSLQNQT